MDQQFKAKMEASGREVLLLVDNCAVEECLLGCGAVWVLLELMFQRNVSPPSSRWKELLITANTVPLKCRVRIRPMCSHIPEGGILHSRHHENLKSYNCAGDPHN
jgi:hypothetical protein